LESIRKSLKQKIAKFSFLGNFLKNVKKMEESMGKAAFLIRVLSHLVVSPAFL